MHGLGMRPGRASLPGLQHPARITQSEHLREAEPSVLQKLGPTPSRSLLPQPDRVRSQNILKPRLQTRCRSCTHAERLGIGDTGKKGRPLECRALTLRCYQL